MKVLIINGGIAYARMFAERGHEVVQSYEEADAIQFCGGEDVSPHLYGELPHPRTHYNTARDEAEIKVFKRAVEDGKVCLGICRGGQFLNVVNGGKMYQHVDNHAGFGKHEAIVLPTRAKVMVTSTHHQMMIPGVSGKILVTAPGQSTYREGLKKDGHLDVNTGMHMDIECVYYPDSKSLCFQPHPEFGGAEECRDLYFDLINRYLNL